MTREELLLMPEEDYMCDLQLEFFRGMLQEQLSQVADRYHDSKEQLETLANATDPVDQAVVDEQRMSLSRSLQRDSQTIKDINLVMADMANYGYSVQSGLPIGLGRLLIFPTATLTVDEQARFERYQMHHARPA